MIALAWTHMLHTSDPADPRLEPFVNYWLGRGAPVSGSGALPKS